MEQWAEIRRLRFVRGLSIREISRRTGLHRETIRRAITSDEAPKYSREGRGSKVDPFKAEIARLLGEDCDLPGVRIGELLEPLGWDGGKTILDDYLREVRPLFRAARTTQRTIYRPGEICQFDVWQTRRPVPVGHGQTRPAWVVVACLGYSRAGAGALVFSKEKPDLLAGIRRCLWQLGGLPDTLVWDRQAGIHGHDGRPSEEFAAFCGQLRVGWHFCRPRDPQAKGAVERLQGFIETNFEPGRVFANERDFQDQLDAWFVKVNARQHPLDRVYPIVYFDAMFVKVREDRSVRSRACYLALGVTCDGEREVLGLWWQETEGAKFWLAVLNDLKRRGVQDVLISCVDGLKGFPEAIEATFPQTWVQTCIVHLIRASLRYVNYRDRKKVASALRPIYSAANADQALEELERFEADWGTRYPPTAQAWRRDWEHVIPFLALPDELRRAVYTTNTIEGLHRQIRKAIKTRGHFPDEQAATKLIYLAIMRADAKWQRNRTWTAPRAALKIHFGDRYPG